MFGWQLPLDAPPAALCAVYYVALALLVAMYSGLVLLLRSLFGRVLEGIRVNEHRMQALGFDTYRYKLAAFVIAGMLAGVAGHMWAMHRGFVNPELIGWHRSAEALLMILLGGLGTLHGPIIGALAFTALGEVAQIDHRAQAAGGGPGRPASWCSRCPRALSGIGLPRWLAAALTAAATARRQRAAASPEARARWLSAPATPPVLATHGLTRRFGGLVAVRDVSISLRQGELHAVIGPNGAGKTTLVNLLSGEIRPTAGRIELDGREVAGEPAWRMTGARRRPLLPAHQHLRLAERAGERAPRGAGGRPRRCAACCAPPRARRR